MSSVSVPDLRSSFAARCLFVLICLDGCVTPASSVAQSNRGLPTRLIAFDIPAQPLDQALDAFGVASGLQVFYESSLTSGRRSIAIKGEFEASVALRALLSGSGLTARVIAAGTVSVGVPADADADKRAERRAELAYLPYYGVLQAGIMKALCDSAEAKPGSYRIILQYWIDPAGRIARSKLIGSSGNNERDVAIMGAVQDIALPPPGDLPQPVTMAIEPTESAGCAPAQALRRP
jgi:hypothetical protein